MKMQYIYSFRVLFFLILCSTAAVIVLRSFPVSAQTAVQLPADKRPPVIFKKKTPLDQPLEEILPININTTDAATLMKVPGINRTAARQIVNHRDKNGKYTSLEQLVGFSGISKSNIVQLKKYLTVE